MIRHFLNYKTRKPLHVHVEREEFGVMSGVLCDGDNFCYPVALVETKSGSGIWEELKDEYTD